MARRPPPFAIIHVVGAGGARLRALADKMGLAYSASEMAGKPGITAFRFEPLDDSQILALFDQTPNEDLVYKAIVGGDPPGFE